jgi:hypothetical protein
VLIGWYRSPNAHLACITNTTGASTYTYTHALSLSLYQSAKCHTKLRVTSQIAPNQCKRRGCGQNRQLVVTFVQIQSHLLDQNAVCRRILQMASLSNMTQQMVTIGDVRSPKSMLGTVSMSRLLTTQSPVILRMHTRYCMAHSQFLDHPTTLSSRTIV